VQRTRPGGRPRERGSRALASPVRMPLTHTRSPASCDRSSDRIPFHSHSLVQFGSFGRQFTSRQIQTWRRTNAVDDGHRLPQFQQNRGSPCCFDRGFDPPATTTASRHEQERGGGAEQAEGDRRRGDGCDPIACVVCCCGLYTAHRLDNVLCLQEFADLDGQTCERIVSFGGAQQDVIMI